MILPLIHIDRADKLEVNVEQVMDYQVAHTLITINKYMIYTTADVRVLFDSPQADLR